MSLNKTQTSKIRSGFLICIASIISINFLLLPHVSYAINSIAEGYRVNANTSQTIDASLISGECRIVTAPNLGKDYFVATKTLPEWNSFLSIGTSLSFTLASCTSCTSTGSFMLQVAGTTDDQGTALAILPTGEIISGGNFEGTNTSIYGNGFSSLGSSDIYIAKLSSTGNLLNHPDQKFAFRAGAGNAESSYSTVTDSSGNILVTGSFAGTNTDIYGQNLTSSGNSDIFLAKFSSTGNLLWAKKAGGISADSGKSTATDSDGNIFLAGYFEGTSSIFGQSITSSGNAEFFLAKLSSTGNLLWVKKGGGSGYDYANSVTTDSLGNIFVTGNFEGTNTDIFGQNLTSSAGYDIFLAKLSSTGNLLWLKKGGGSGYDYGSSITTDSDNNLVITGHFQDTNTDVFGQSLTSSGDYDVFLAKLSSTGNLMWAKKAGGTSSDYGFSTATDSLGNVIVTGGFDGTDTDVFGQPLTSPGYYGIFLAKLSSTGNLMWAKSAGDSGYQYTQSTTTDPDDNILVTGVFMGTNADFFGEPLTSTGGMDLFLAKLSSTGNLMWSKRAGGTAWDYSQSVATDPSGNILLTGQFSSQDMDIFGELLGALGTTDDIYLVKLDPEGNLFSLPTRPQIEKAGASGADILSDMASSGSGNILVAGSFEGTSTDIFSRTLSSSGGADGFIAYLYSSGSLINLAYTPKKAGGISGDHNGSSTIDSSGNIIAAGYFYGTNTDIFGQNLTSSGYGADIFLAKLSSTGNLMWAKRAGSDNDEFVRSTTTDSSGNIIVTGYYYGTPDIFGQYLSNSGTVDVFLAKLSSTGNLIWAKKAGGTWIDYADSTATDLSGNILVSGYFGGTTDMFGQSLTSFGNADIFLAKLSSTGNLMWAQKAGSTGWDETAYTVSDIDNNILTTGKFQGTANIFGQSLTSSGSYDIFLAKLSSTGNLMWAKKAGGTGYDGNPLLISDSSGNTLVMGTFEGTSSIFGQSLTSAGDWDIFLAKLSSTGNLMWAKRTGGSLTEFITSVSTNADGNILVTGVFDGIDADIFGQPLSGSGENDIFLAKLTSTGNLIWAKKTGGNLPDAPSYVNLGLSGSIIVTGDFQGMPTIFGQNLTSSGSDDMFIAKLDTNGNPDPSFATPPPMAYKMGGAGEDSVEAVDIDANDNLIIGGYFEGTNTDIFGYPLSSSGLADIFLAKFSSNGNLLYFPPNPFLLKGGNSGRDSADSSATDSLGNILITGYFEGTNTNLFGQTFTSSGNYDVYLAKLSSTGNLLWVKKGGGTSKDYGISVFADSSGNVLVTGYFQGTNTDLFGQNLSSSGVEDIFVAKLSSTGNLMWLKKGGGTTTDIGYATTSDLSGNILVTGYFQGTNTDLFGQNLSSSGGPDVFVTKLSSTGNLMWLKRGGGTYAIGSEDTPNSISTDVSGNVIVSGNFGGTNTDLFGQTLTSSGNADLFVAKLSSTGNIMWVRKGGGSLSETAISTIDPSGNVLVTGRILGTNIDIFGQSFTSSGVVDTFVAKLSSTGNLMWITQGSGASTEISRSISSDGAGNVIIGGNFGGGATNLFGQSFTSSGVDDIFLAKFSTNGNLMWVKKGGGSSSDYAYSTSTDPNGNVLVTGTYQGSNTDLFGQSLSSSGNEDIFLAKFDTSGNLLSLPLRPHLYKAGGTGNDSITDIDTSSSGNILVSGDFVGTNTDIFSLPVSSSGGGDGFAVFLDQSGSVRMPFYISKKGGGFSYDSGLSTTTDTSGNIIVTGYFDGFGTDLFGQSLTSSGWADIFLAKLSSTGNLMWVKKGGGAEYDNGYSTKTDSSDNIIITGDFFDDMTDIDLFGQSFYSSGENDIFVAKLSSTGNLMWVKKGGGIYGDSGLSTTTDSSGSVLVTGYFQETNTDLFGQNLSSSGGFDIFLAKLSSTGNVIWMKRGGGISDDSGNSITTDSFGNVIVTGYFQDSNTDLFGQNLTSSGVDDIFVAKLSSTGNLMWVKKGGGTSYDRGFSTATDPSGNILVTGYFQGTNTDLFGQNLSSSGAEDIFVAKLSSTGNLMWLKKGGGTLDDYSYATTLDTSGNILVTGYFQGTNTDLFGQNLSSSGATDIFLAKLSSTGNVMWLKRGGNISQDLGVSTATDSGGNILVTGNFQDSRTEIFGQNLTSSGYWDIFLAKLDPNGNPDPYFTTSPMLYKMGGTGADSVTAVEILSDGSFVAGGTFEGEGTLVPGVKFTKRGGATGADGGNSITSDSAGNILVAGSFFYDFPYTTDIFGQTFTSSGDNDIFLAKLSSTGNLIWAKKAGNTLADSASSTVTDVSGNVLVTGSFQGSNTSIFGQLLSSSGVEDIYLAKLSSTGNLIWAKKSGGTLSDISKSTSTDSSGNVLVTGSFQGTNTDIFGQSLTSSGVEDIFVAKLTSTGNLMWAKKAGGISSDIGTSIATDPSGNILVAGTFSGSNIDIFGQTFTSSGNNDIFLAKFSSTGGLMWAKKAGGANAELYISTSTDNSGNILVSGDFFGTTVDIFGQNLTSAVSYDVFVAKLSSTGGLLWTKTAGGNSTDRHRSISTDPSGNVLVTGYFQGTSTDIFGTSLTSSGSWDVFAAKLSSTGNLIWAKKAGGATLDDSASIATDPSGNILVTGYFQGTNIDHFGKPLTSTGGTDIFVAKLDPNGDLYSSIPDYYVGGTDVFGTTIPSSGSTDVFLSRILPSGMLDWTIKGGGVSTDSLTDIVLDQSGYLLVSGHFSGSNVDIFGGTVSSSGGTDSFVAKIDTEGNTLWVKRGGGIGDDSINALLPGTLSIFTTGYFSLSGSDLYSQSFTSAGGKDGFILRLDSEGEFCTP